MAEFQNTIDLYGDETVAAKIVGKEIEDFADDILSNFGAYAFYDCRKLTSVNLPNVTKIPNSAFYNGIALFGVNFPSAVEVGIDAFRSCSKLTSINFPCLTNIGAGAFYSCTKLDTLVIGGGTVCALGNVNAFTGTPFRTSGKSGTVYVPQALIESYKTATNWSTLYAAGTCNFVAIEGSEYE